MNLLRFLTGLASKRTNRDTCDAPVAGSKTDAGLLAEQQARRFLKRKRYKIIARNYRCTAGEIDIIARDGQTIAFVEVKSRTSTEAGRPQENISQTKKTRLLRAAKAFLASNGWQDRPCRFDVVTVVADGSGPPDIEHYIDAWQAYSEY